MCRIRLSLDAADAGHDCTGEDLHDRAACLGGRFSLNSDFTARTAQAVMDAKGIGQCSPHEEWESPPVSTDVRRCCIDAALQATKEALNERAVRFHPPFHILIINYL